MNFKTMTENFIKKASSDAGAKVLASEIILYNLGLKYSVQYCAPVESVENYSDTINQFINNLKEIKSDQVGTNISGWIWFDNGSLGFFLDHHDEWVYIDKLHIPEYLSGGFDE